MQASSRRRGSAEFSSTVLAAGKTNGEARGTLLAFDPVYQSPEPTAYTVFRATFQKSVVWYRFGRDGKGSFTSLRNA